jgi:gliding motility-associated-like protein
MKNFLNMLLNNAVKIEKIASCVAGLLFVFISRHILKNMNLYKYIAVYSFILILLSMDCRAQTIMGKEWNNWYFGNKTAITFNTSPPSVIESSEMFASEGCASISDRSGNLLFYTNGDTVWNKNNQKMQNGGIGYGNHMSAANGVIILPQPGHDSLYYIFQSPQMDMPGNFEYAVVNMNADGGSGAVISTDNTLIQYPVIIRHEENIGVTKHRYKNAWWVLTYNSQRHVVAYLLDSNGLSTTAVESAFDDFGVAYLTFSPDGKYLADGQGIYTFDNITGLVINRLGKFKYFANYHAFSPDGTKYYSFSFYRLIQIDLLNPPGSDNIFDETMIFDASRRDMEAFMLAPDNKIYINRYNNDSLDVINNPNALGLSCNYQRNVINLNKKNKGNGVGLPVVPAGIIHYQPPKPIQKYTDCHIYFPNAFTPNEDSINQKFGMVSDCPVSNYVFTIYNRWGEVIYVSKDQLATWDGKFRNYPCPEGTYLYKLVCKTADSDWAFRSGLFYLLK